MTGKRDLAADALLYGMGVSSGIHVVGLRDTAFMLTFGVAMALLFTLVALFNRLLRRAWTSAFSGTIEGNSSAWGILHGPDGIRIAFGRRVWRP